jgi:hypothetical protein
MMEQKGEYQKFLKKYFECLRVTDPQLSARQRMSKMNAAWRNHKKENGIVSKRDRRRCPSWKLHKAWGILGNRLCDNPRDCNNLGKL